MKLLHLASEFPPAKVFGLGRYVHDLARAQVRMGHEVHVVTNSLSGKDQECAPHGIQVHRINFPSPPMPTDGATQVTQFNNCIYERVLQLRDRLRGPAAVVAHDWLTILSADLVRKRLGGRLVFTVHDTVIGKTFGNMIDEDKYIALVERWGCQVADAVVPVSRHVADELTGVYGAPPEKLHVVPCAVDPAWFGSVDARHLPDLRSAVAAPGDAIVTYVGRLDREKGVDRLLEAISVLARKNRVLRLLIAGKGSEQSRLEALAKSQGIEDRVRFLGYVTGPALEALYKITTILVCPSLYEPFGIVPLEGMINRLPVIVSDTGGMAEIVEHGQSGLKVPPGDARALEGAIDALLKDPGEAQRLATGGYARATQVYSWDSVAERLDAPYGLVRPRMSTSATVSAPAVRGPQKKLTAGIRVKNGERFAEECLRDLSLYTDEIVILDDGSTDHTVNICKSFRKVTNIVRWEKDFFHEGIDRNVVLALVKNTNPDWILLPDIDEVFEDRLKEEVHRMMDRSEVDLYAFLFCHFWRSRTHYRVDGNWGRESREFPIPRLVRNLKSLQYPVHRPLGTAQITGVKGNCVLSDIRVKHYGHLYEDISKQKTTLYSSLDPESDYSYMVNETGLQLEEWKEAEVALAGDKA